MVSYPLLENSQKPINRILSVIRSSKTNHPEADLKERDAKQWI